MRTFRWTVPEPDHSIRGGLPVIVSSADRWRDWIGRLLILAGLITTGLFDNPLLGSMCGLTLIIVGFVRQATALRCPRCDDKWQWRAWTTQPFSKVGKWLANLKACPKCGYPQEDVRVSVNQAA